MLSKERDYSANYNKVRTVHGIRKIVTLKERQGKAEARILEHKLRLERKTNLLLQNILHLIHPEYILAVKSRNLSHTKTETALVAHTPFYLHLFNSWTVWQDMEKTKNRRSLTPTEENNLQEMKTTYLSLAQQVKSNPLYTRCLNALSVYGHIIDPAPHNFIISEDNTRITYVDSPESFKIKKDERTLVVNIQTLLSAIRKIEDNATYEQALKLYKKLQKTIKAAITKPVHNYRSHTMK